MESHQQKFSSQRAQVEIWREIVTAQYDPSPTQQVSDHLKFIKEGARRLDATGFIWTRESVLGILFQNGLSLQFPNCRTNQILDKRVKSSGSTSLSASEIKEVIEAEDSRMKSSTISFMSLPTESITTIFREVAKTDVIDNHQNFSLQLLCPLTLVNRLFLDICRPILWRVSH